MAIITISRGCYSHGQEIAQCVAAKLSYACVSQEEVLQNTSSSHSPENQLIESLHDAPGIIERISHARQRFIDEFQAALLAYVVKDGVVYHGFAGQILLGNISHVIKVRVVADMEDRIRLLKRQQHLTRKEAQHIIEKEDHERAEWYRTIYRIDMNDPAYYDIVLHIGQLTIPEACDIICHAAGLDSFSTTPASQFALMDLSLESNVRCALAEICKADVVSKEGIVHIRVKGNKLKAASVTSPDVQHQVQDQIRQDLYDKIISVVTKIPEVKDIDCVIDMPYYA